MRVRDAGCLSYTLISRAVYLLETSGSAFPNPGRGKIALRLSWNSIRRSRAICVLVSSCSGDDLWETLLRVVRLLTAELRANSQNDELHLGRLQRHHKLSFSTMDDVDRAAMELSWCGLNETGWDVLNRILDRGPVWAHFDSLRFTLLIEDLMGRHILSVCLITMRARYTVSTVEETLPRRL